MPVRFCRVQDLADLRRSIPGPAPLTAFSESVLSGEHVLQRGFAKAIAQSHMDRQAVVSELVRVFLSLQTSKAASVVER